MTSNSNPPPDPSPTPSSNSAQPKNLTSLNGNTTSEVARSAPPAWLPIDSSISKSTGLQAPKTSLLVLLTVGIMVAGWWLQIGWIALAGAIVAVLIAGRVVWTAWRPLLSEIITDEQWTVSVSVVALSVALYSILRFVGITRRFADWYNGLNWDELGASAELIGAVGQISIAVLAVYVAWRQYVISKDLTIQQNLITQQQTIDSYFQGISELVLDEEGLLEDVPQERAIAEGRTAAILSSVDGTGKAKILRFLSRSRLLTPLRRDRRLGRAILDGTGGYAEDRDYGVRVIDLGIMLAVANLARTDLRWTDLSDANLIRADLSHCDLVKTNFARTILYEANLSGADLMGTRFFYGPAATASPRSRTETPDYKTGTFTGAVVENVNFSNAVRMSEEQRQYCCAWGGSATRSTIPGGCEGIPNRLGR